MLELTMTLEAGGGVPLYEQIYRHIRDEIRTGGIEKGERLPSGRSLSSQLGVSRSTVDLAYSQLVCEGYVEAVPYRGYFACETAGLYDIPEEEKPVAPESQDASKKCDFDMKPVGIDLTGFPFDRWRKINRDLLTEEMSHLLRNGSSLGEEGLRESIAKYVHSARAVNCRPEQVVVGSGNDYLLSLLSFVLGREGAVAMESPGYVHARGVFEAAGMEVKAVPADAFGMRTDRLAASGADIAYVMPSHQFPLGTVMPVGRRQELISWAAQKEGRFIIEDDYDSEFRYRGKPIPSLQGQDAEGRVIYLGTFSQSLAPAIRISYLVLPENLLKKAEETLGRFSPTVSRLDQTSLDIFMREGHFERHLNRMRRIYSRKRDILLGELKKLSPAIAVSGERAGVHLLITFKNGMEEGRAVELAGEKGVRVYPLSAYVLDRSAHEGIRESAVLAGYAGLSENELLEASERLIDAWG